MANGPVIQSGSPVLGAAVSSASTAAVSTTSATAAAPPPASFTYSVNRQRIPVTLDPLSDSRPAGAKGAIQSLRTTGTQKIYLAIQKIQTQLPKITTILKTPVVPSQLMGQLLEPGGTPASTVQIEFDPSQAGLQGRAVTTITGTDGTFTLAIPGNLAFPSGGLALSVRGADTPNPVPLTVSAGQVGPNGYVSNLKLPTAIAPLPVSISKHTDIDRDRNCVLLGMERNKRAKATNPTVTLGEDGGCQLKFETNYSVDSFPYSVFYRLVEPQLSVSSVASTAVDPTNNKNFYYLPDYVDTQLALAPAGAAVPAATTRAAGATPTPAYIDRVPVEQPISVDGFRDSIIGVNPDGFIGADETVPKVFASDPTADVAQFGGAAEEVVNFSLSGTFLSCEHIYVSAVTRRNTRVGPVELTGLTPTVATNTYSSQDALVAELSTQRNGTPSKLTGSLALPQTMNGGRRRAGPERA